MSSARSAEDPRPAVNVIGFLDDALGLAQAARLYIDGLRAAGVPVTTTAIAPDPAALRGGRPDARASATTISCGRRSSRV